MALYSSARKPPMPRLMSDAAADAHAKLWCWIKPSWGALRLYTYYLLVWICILASLAIYVGLGIYVFRVRNRLRQVSGSGSNVRGMMSYQTTTNENENYKVCDRLGII